MIKNWNRLELAGYLAFAAAIVCVAGLGYRTELRWVGVGLVLVTFLVVFSLLRLLALGPIFASTVSVGCVFAIYTASKFKFWLTGRRLHPYDVYSYGNPKSLLYVKDLYPAHYLYLYAALAAAALILLLVFALERFRRPAWTNVAVFGLLLSAAIVFNRTSHLIEGGGLGDGNRFMHFDHQHISTFALSSVLAVPQLVAGDVFEYGPPALGITKVAAMTSGKGCKVAAGTAAPNIIVILRESIVIPGNVPGMGAPQPDESRFRSFDGRTHQLRVETYGAGSAHTIFSIMSGLSSEAFGGLKNVDIDMTPAGLRYSLPMLLKECGYETSAITTGSEGYVASREFYRALGFEHYTDLDDMRGPKGGFEDLSDRGVYRFLVKQIARQNTDKPKFVYVDTTASHAPYDASDPLRPEDTVPEAASIQNSVVAEYVRRVVLGERDLDHFGEAFAQSEAGGQRPVVVLDFGDHHPYFTKDLPGHPGFVNEDRNQDDPHLLTYFRIRSWGGYPLHALPDHPTVDVAFVSDWLVRALGFQVGDPYAYRWRLLERCRSRYWQCDGGSAAHELHQALRAANLINFR